MKQVTNADGEVSIGSQTDDNEWQTARSDGARGRTAEAEHAGSGTAQAIGPPGRVSEQGMPLSSRLEESRGKEPRWPGGESPAPGPQQDSAARQVEGAAQTTTRNRPAASWNVPAAPCLAGWHTLARASPFSSPRPRLLPPGVKQSIGHPLPIRLVEFTVAIK